MSLFSKKRGRRKKNSLSKKITMAVTISIFFLVILPISWVFYSFSAFGFLLPYQTKIIGDTSQKSDQKTYIITLHNEGEIRPNLGFLTSFIVLSVHGKNFDYQFYDSYGLEAPKEKIKAPKMLESRFADAKKWQGWTFRDSNLSLSYPENAQKIIEFLQYDKKFANLQVDGVFALDLYAVGKIIDSLGGVEFEGETISSENIFSILESSSKNFDHHNLDEWKNRKSSLAPLATKILRKTAFSPHKWKNFSQNLSTLLEQKHILLFFVDRELQKKIREKKWTGELFIPEKSLILGNNIANIGGRKGDRYIEKNFSSLFSVEANGQITETFKIYLQHNGNYSLHSDRYFAEIQFIRNQNSYSPKAFQDGKNIDISSEIYNGVKVFSFPITLDPGKSKFFEVTILHPKKVSFEKNLEIFSLHQPGVIEQNTSIVFQGQGNTSFTIRNCEKFTKNENISSCHFSDTKDETFVVSYEKDTHLPLLERSTFIDEGKKVEVVFSENIASLLPGHVLVREKQSLEIIETERIFVEGKKLVIEFSSPLPKSPRTFYTLQINNLSDLFGNTKEFFQTTLAYPKIDE